MNNYKFRGKTAEGVWKHGSYVGVRGNSYIVDDEYGISWDVRPETLGQWTGLFDIKNKEIYHNDTCYAEINGRHIKIKVIWHGAGFYGLAKDADYALCEPLGLFKNLELLSPEILEDK